MWQLHGGVMHYIFTKESYLEYTYAGMSHSEREKFSYIVLEWDFPRVWNIDSCEYKDVFLVYLPPTLPQSFTAE